MFVAGLVLMLSGFVPILYVLNRESREMPNAANDRVVSASFVLMAVGGAVMMISVML